mmetsp:Transcript_18183/g.63912  ORF Transcript_18183/g.63912 Transcript_18183/m.63912 type:complete len:212 (-) Transcript_18183:387-1022(-)
MSLLGSDLVLPLLEQLLQEKAIALYGFPHHDEAQVLNGPQSHVAEPLLAGTELGLEPVPQRPLGFALLRFAPPLREGRHEHGLGAGEAEAEQRLLRLELAGGQKSLQVRLYLQQLLLCRLGQVCGAHQASHPLLRASDPRVLAAVLLLNVQAGLDHDLFHDLVLDVTIILLFHDLSYSVSVIGIRSHAHSASRQQVHRQLLRHDLKVFAHF